MKRLHLLFILPALVSMAACSNEKSVFVETESFENKGGWVLNQMFMDQMGSPYLMAHGIGTPVEDASTSVSIPSGGTYHVFARTFNWTSPWKEGEGPGKFTISIGGTELPSVLGAEGNKWDWQYAGEVKLEKGTVTLCLHDLTGFDGRCDAIFITPDRNPDISDTETLRRKMTPGYDKVAQVKEYDLVVVGGGMGGISAAVSAARLGLKTALIHDRGVLGGNNSSEIRVHRSGMACEAPYPNLGLLQNELEDDNVINGHNDGRMYGDEDKKRLVDAEENLDVFYNEHVCKVDKDGENISAVYSRNTESGVLTGFKAPLFADCTGDGNLGYLAGADYRVGRESKAETGERSAAKVADKQVLGASVLWNTVEDSVAVEFPDFNYGVTFSDESVRPVTHGEWTWETGLRKDQVEEAEWIRDYGMLVAYSNWSYLKNHYKSKANFASRRLNWVSYNAGKRESRRLLGEYILNQTDIEDFKEQPDGTASLSWSIDLHYPNPENSKYFPGEEFITVCNQDPVKHYPIPYRCYYSRNVRNMFMAGRNISVTHAALGSVRVMRTISMMGEVVGMAASICKKHGCLPGDVYRTYLDELKTLMTEGIGRKDIPYTIDYHLGQTNLEKFSSPDVE